MIFRIQAFVQGQNDAIDDVASVGTDGGGRPAVSENGLMCGYAGKKTTHSPYTTQCQWHSM